jgi:hypothetical protein
MMMYRIAWVSRRTGVTGAGACFQIPLDELQRYVDDLNRHTTELRYWIEPCVS